MARVYPRACGGTYVCADRRRLLWGLSPRVRGNLISKRRQSAWIGSIPARAGEPLNRYWVKTESGVYPRACGGTSCNQVLEFP